MNLKYELLLVILTVYVPEEYLMIKFYFFKKTII